jgi:DNA-binding CsgD family transcriptional regulator
MDDPAELERKLSQLTQRQAQILTLVCQGLTYRQIASEIGYGVDLVQAEMSQVYRLLGWKKRSTTEKRRLLITVICPIHARLMANPETDAAHRVIDVGPVQPDPETIDQVRKDEQNGLIPLDRALVRVETERGTAEPTPPRELIQRPGYPLVAYPPSRSNRLPWILATVLATLLVAALIVIAFLLVRGNSTPPVALSQPPPAVTVATVIITQQMVVTQPPVTVLVTQPAPTAIPTVQPTPVYVTVVVTPVPTTAVPPTSAPTPLTSKSGPCTPHAGTVNLSGKVASEIPGTSICLGDTVSSVIDRNTRPIDVYALDLTAGQEVLFSVSTQNGCLNLELYNPGSKSIETDEVSIALNPGCWQEWKQNFTAAVSGKYYFAVAANSSGQVYTFSVKPTGTTVPGNQVVSDIPGTRLVVGNTVNSVVDRNTKPFDVYAIDFSVGQAVLFKVATNNGCLNLELYNPGSKSLETDQASVALNPGCWQEWKQDFTPAVTGTYYFAVGANSSGQTYTLSITAMQ